MTDLIRQMNSYDIDKIYAIEKDVHVAPWCRNILSDCILVGYDCRVLEVSVNGASVVGGYIISRNSNDHSHILNISIAKAFQSKGYGRYLLEHVLGTLSQSERLKYAFLEVRPSNFIALHLYLSLGFIEVEIKKEYYKDEKCTEDAIVLQKMINRI